jgi:hypothetical protein
MRRGLGLSTMAHMRERERPELPLPRGRLDRALLAVGAAALIAAVPMLSSWLLYGSGLSESGVIAGGVGVCLLTAGIGAAMIRILDGIR